MAEGYPRWEIVDMFFDWNVITGYSYYTKEVLILSPDMYFQDSRVNEVISLLNK